MLARLGPHKGEGSGSSGRTQNRHPLLLIARAHDPPKCERFGEEIMRLFNVLARDHTQNRHPLLLIARL